MATEQAAFIAEQQLVMDEVEKEIQNTLTGLNLLLLPNWMKSIRGYLKTKCDEGSSKCASKIGRRVYGIAMQVKTHE